MVVIYTDKITPRLRYACGFVFWEQMKLEWMLTEDENCPISHPSFFINYSTKQIKSAHAFIRPHGLLHQTGIIEQNPNVKKKVDGAALLFPTENDSLGFDLFSAVFYLLSRYEEYLPYVPDSYGRFPHEKSIAFQNDFLHQPIVNIWISRLVDVMQAQVPELHITKPDFQCRISYDIDMAWSYKYKGLLRNLIGFIKKPEIKRWRVLLGLEPDPFDTFERMDSTHEKNHTTCIYFFLMARRLSRYDKNIRVFKKSMQKLIRTHAEKYMVGLHPSWRSHRITRLLAKEKRALEEISGIKIFTSRQHYVKWQLPKTFQRLIENGITEDYSMGYGSINGFRASVASSFYWYDLEKEEATPLRLHPFCFMDANCLYEQKLNVEESEKELMYYYDITRQYGSAFIPVFHNHFLGSDHDFNGWIALWERFLQTSKSTP